MELIFTVNDDVWRGGFYDLAIEFVAHDEPRLLRARAAIRNVEPRAAAQQGAGDRRVVALRAPTRGTAPKRWAGAG